MGQSFLWFIYLRGCIFTPSILHYWPLPQSHLALSDYFPTNYAAYRSIGWFGPLSSATFSFLIQSLFNHFSETHFVLRLQFEISGEPPLLPTMSHYRSLSINCLQLFLRAFLSFKAQHDLIAQLHESLLEGFLCAQYFQILGWKTLLKSLKLLIQGCLILLKTS